MGANKSATVAIIGSFRQHYDAVLTAHREFTSRGIQVTSPLGARVLVEGIPFVRFETDAGHLTDAGVQEKALELILGSDAVYVVAPSGYVGRTTCYEIGRILERGVPLYFTEHPVDLPILVDAAHILDAAELAELILERRVEPLDSAKALDSSASEL